VRHLLKRGANKNRLAMMSGGPLHMAVTVGGAVDIVKLLVREGADIHLRNNQHGRTPLHVLCTDTVIRHLPSVSCPLHYLLTNATKSCDIYLQNMFQTYTRIYNPHTPRTNFHTFTHIPPTHDCKIPKKKKKKKARPWDDSKGCLRPMKPLLLALLDCCDHARDKDRMGRTPLALAVLSKRLPTVQLLLDHRRKEGSPDSITNIHVKVGERTSDVSVPDKEGLTILHHATMIGNVI
jgi:hypothetical protein